MPPLFDPALQPRVDAIIQWVQLALLIAGGLAAVAWVIALILGGRARQPLADIPLTGGGPGLLHLGLTVFAFLALLQIASAILATDKAAARQEPQVPGSHAFHVNVTAHASAQLAACIPIIFILSRCPALGSPPVRLKRRRWFSAGLRTASVVLLTTLILFPVVWLQLEMGRVIWRWLHPDISPPIHMSLTALRDSTWGVWGVVQSAFTAIVVAPIAEELLFRGLLLETVTRYSRSAWVGIALSAVAFGMIHDQPQDKLPLITMGLILGYVRVRWGSLERCMLIHALFNAYTIACTILAPDLLERI